MKHITIYNEYTLIMHNILNEIQQIQIASLPPSYN